MKSIATSLLLAIFLLGSSLADESLKPLPANELAWFYTLAVHHESENFSFSLMKDGWLAFDTWSEASDFNENRIELSADQFASLRAKFESLFLTIQKIESHNTDEKPSYTFEKVSDSVTTIEFSGYHPSVEAFLVELSKITKKPLPFSLNQAVEDKSDNG